MIGDQVTTPDHSWQKEKGSGTLTRYRVAAEVRMGLRDGARTRAFVTEIDPSIYRNFISGRTFRYSGLCMCFTHGSVAANPLRCVHATTPRSRLSSPEERVCGKIDCRSASLVPIG